MREAVILAVWAIVTAMPFISGVAVTFNMSKKMPAGFRVLLAVTLGLAILSVGILIVSVFGGVSLSRVAVLQAVVLLGIMLLRPECRRLRPRFARLQANIAPWAVIAIAATLICLFGMLIAVVRIEPADDAVSHHLPMAQWINEHGSLRISDSFRLPTRPAQIALLFGWVLLGSGGRLELLGLMNISFALMFGLAGFNICRVLGCGSGLSLWAFALILGNYVITDQVQTLYIDTAFSAFVVASFAFGLAYHRWHGREYILGSALAAGLAIGAKPQGVLFLPMMALPFIAPIVTRQAVVNLPKVARVMFAWAGLAFLVGGFWFVRNLFVTAPPGPDDDLSLDFARRTCLLFNLSGFVREYGLRGFVSSVAGQVSWVTVASVPAMIALLIGSRAVSRRLGVDNGLMHVFLAAVIFSSVLLLLMPCTARHFPHSELLNGGQLRYGIVTIALLNICWIPLLAGKPMLLPLLCLGLALPGSRFAITSALASTGVIFASLTNAKTAEPE